LVFFLVEFLTVEITLTNAPSFRAPILESRLSSVQRPTSTQTANTQHTIPYASLPMVHLVYNNKKWHFRVW
jgi:hypothetical protein